ncbi:efflux RND transporter permease subunit [Luminiphilus sp.]|nr:efflux RND transporter permease subunit [Luminiphilus sp.]
MIATKLYENGRYLALMVLSTIVVGITSYNSLGRQEDPSITPFVASVQTFYPGASPARVESLVTKPLEDALREHPDIKEVDSTSVNGVSSILIQADYYLSRSDIKRVWSELGNKIDRVKASLPEGASEPVFDDDLFTNFVKIVSVSSQPGIDLSPSLLRREALRLADAAKNVPQTRRVKLYGLPDEEISVEVDATALATLGLETSDIARTLSLADSRTPAGKLTSPQSALTIEVAGEFTNIDTVRETYIQAANGGAKAVRVGDIASVSKSEIDPPLRLALSNGKRSVFLGIEMKEGNQVDQYSDSFNAFLTEYRQSTADGMLIEVSYDQSGYTEARLTGVLKNILAGVLIVVGVLFITLGWRAALIVALSLPLCTLLSMMVLNYLDIRIHQMSMTGLVVALGLLVDGSIVITDEIRRHLLAGDRPLAAMQKAVNRMTVPLVSATATTVLAFTPMAILAGPSGDFLGSLATCVIVMLTISLLLALTLTPAIAARVLPSGISQSPAWWRTGISVPSMVTVFTKSIDWSLRYPLASVLIAGSIPVLGFVSAATLTNQFFPGTDRDQVYIRLDMPSTSGIEETLALVNNIDNDLQAEPLIRRVDWSVGESPPAFYYNLRSNRRNAPGWAEAMILTTDENQTNGLIRRLQTQFDRNYPEAQVIVLGIDQGPPVAAPLEVIVYGPNSHTLRSLGETFRRRMQSLPDITHTRLSITPAAPKVQFVPDSDKLRRLGIERTQLAQLIEGRLRGRIGGAVLEDTERLNVRVKLERDNWQSSDDLLNLTVPVIDNKGLTQQVPLANLGRLELIPEDAPIGRKNGERVNEVQAFLTRGVLPEEALKLLRASLEDNPISMPPGYRYSFGGDSAERDEVVNDLIGPVGLVLSLLVGTIMLTFNSWRLTALAFGVVVCAFGLSFLALALFRYPLGIQALIGVVGSIGVAINACIIILTSFQQSPAASNGDKLAMRNEVLAASRHIVSTTLTTFGGFLPLILEGSQFWPPFAMAIAGGVLLSTIVSFYLVPPAYVLLGAPRDNRIERALQQADQAYP